MRFDRHKLRYYRDIRNISQLSMATEVGIGQSYYCELENGNKDFKVKILQAVMNKLNLSLAEQIDLLGLEVDNDEESIA